MSKGLIALNDLRCMLSFSQDCNYNESNDLCDIVEKDLKEYEKLKEDIKKCSCWNEHKALDIIKVLFQDRCKLYERTENIETCNEQGCHAEKIATTSYILEFNNYDLHYEFRLHKGEYDLLKEVL